MDARIFCVPAAITALPGKLALREFGIQLRDPLRIDLQLVGVHQAVHAGVKERRQSHRSEDRDAVFEIRHQGGIAARRHQLVGRNRFGDGYEHRNSVAIDNALLARGAIVVEQGHGAFDRHERDRGDAPDVESADVVFAAHVRSG